MNCLTLLEFLIIYFPNDLLTFEAPSVIYTFSHLHIHTFTNPYSPKFSILTNVSIGTCIRDDSTLLCHCADSCVKDKDKGHILTQDLKIIDNNKLRKLSTGGTKYRKRMSIKLKETMPDLVLA